MLGHSQGGLIALDWWSRAARHERGFSSDGVTHLFSLDSPVNGACYAINCSNVAGYPPYPQSLTQQDPKLLALDNATGDQMRLIGTEGDTVPLRAGGAYGPPGQTTAAARSSMSSARAFSPARRFSRPASRSGPLGLRSPREGSRSSCTALGSRPPSGRGLPASASRRRVRDVRSPTLPGLSREVADTRQQLRRRSGDLVNGYDMIPLSGGKPWALDASPPIWWWLRYPGWRARIAT